MQLRDALKKANGHRGQGNSDLIMTLFGASLKTLYNVFIIKAIIYLKFYNMLKKFPLLLVCGHFYIS